MSFNYFFFNILIGNWWKNKKEFCAKFTFDLWILTYDAIIYACTNFLSQVSTYQVWTIILGGVRDTSFCSHTHAHSGFLHILTQNDIVISFVFAFNPMFNWMLNLRGLEKSIEFSSENLEIHCSGSQSDSQTNPHALTLSHRASHF